jgi:biotin carboxyl carrier protein
MSKSSEVFGHTPTSLRVVVSPAAGRLRYLPPQRFVGGAELVEAGQPVARLLAAGEEILVVAPVGGRVSSVLGIEGEPVVRGQAVLAIEPDPS